VTTRVRKSKRAALPKPRPLLVRPGARFRCFGDGTCCTDIHAAGPIGRDDRKTLSLIADGVCVRMNGGKEYMLATKGDGTCVFLGDAVCELHAALGPEIKAMACTRFPYELTTTPSGGRVSTEHRCPCRTMGDRPALSLEDAERALSNRGGRLRAHCYVGARVPLTRKRHVSFARWQWIEAALFERLFALEDPADVLDAHGLPELDGVAWREVAGFMRTLSDRTRAEMAFLYLSDAIAVDVRLPIEPRSRPWSSSFDRAEARSEEVDPREIYADWLADEVWAMRWTTAGNFARARRDMGARYYLAKRIAARIRDEEGARPDRAAAEAGMIVDVARETEFWEPAVAAMRDD